MENARVIVVLGVLAIGETAVAVDHGRAVYVGGTLVVKEKTEAPIDLKGEDGLVFRPKGATVRIPWSGIDEIEY